MAFQVGFCFPTHPCSLAQEILAEPGIPMRAGLRNCTKSPKNCLNPGSNRESGQPRIESHRVFASRSRTKAGQHGNTPENGRAPISNRPGVPLPWLRPSAAICSQCITPWSAQQAVNRENGTCLPSAVLKQFYHERLLLGEAPQPHRREPLGCLLEVFLFPTRLGSM